MQVILAGQRSDGTPLVLVRCACGEMTWSKGKGHFIRCSCGRWVGKLTPQLSLAEADAQVSQERAA